MRQHIDNNKYRRNIPPELERRQEKFRQDSRIDLPVTNIPFIKGITYFNKEDFIPIQQEGKTVLVRILPKDFFLIVFVAEKCPGSIKLLPILKKMIQDNIKIGIVNINTNNNMQLIRMLNGTKMPIKDTPTMFIYYDGKPHVEIKGDLTEQNIKQAIKTTMSNTKTNKQEQKSKNTEDFSMGIPFNMLCDNGKCYTTSDEIYNSQKSIQYVCTNGICTYKNDDENYK